MKQFFQTFVFLLFFCDYRAVAQTCFHNTIHKPIAHDCVNAVITMMTLITPVAYLSPTEMARNREFTWHRPNWLISGPITIPTKYQAGTCMVVIGNANDRLPTITTSLQTVQDAAVHLIRFCVEERNRAGHITTDGFALAIMHPVHFAKSLDLLQEIEH